MKKFMKALKIIFLVVIGYFVITAGIYMPFVISDAQTPHNDECDYLMVLGNQVVGEDTPSELMLERVERAVEYVNENEDCKIVVCGGITTEVQTISESALMKKLLTEKGVNPDRIILEDKSTTTFENFEFAKAVIENDSGKDIGDVKVAFLSSDYHMHRSGVIANHFGFKDVGRVSCKTENGFAKTLVREYFVGYDLMIRLIRGK